MADGEEYDWLKSVRAKYRSESRDNIRESSIILESDRILSQFGMRMSDERYTPKPNRRNRGDHTVKRWDVTSGFTVSAVVVSPTSYSHDETGPTAIEKTDGVTIE